MAGRRLTPIFTLNFVKNLDAVQEFLVRDPIVAFLAIKHHRQLSFVLHRFWP
jgi:hypothetical protein